MTTIIQSGRLATAPSSGYDALLDAARCECASRRDDDGRPMMPELAECGTCGFRWCARCHPAPSARTPCEAWHDYEEEPARYYDPPDPDTFGPIMAAIAAGDFKHAAGLLSELERATSAAEHAGEG